jgi:hypothetical protein
LDANQFDALSRTIVNGLGRRGLLRAFLGGTLPSLLATLETDARPRTAPRQAHGHRRDRQRHGDAPSHHDEMERAAHGQPHPEGRRKGKKRRKKSPPPPLPPGCQNCNECQMCQDGACVPDPALEGVRCLGSGTACGYCQGGHCASSIIPACPDGVCPQKGKCCSDEQFCDDPESPIGFICLPPDACCPEKKKCADRCIDRRTCCPDEQPPCGQCSQPVCFHGFWRCESQQKPCPDGTCVAQDQCCPGQRHCPGETSCIAVDECCPNQIRCGGTCIDTSVYQCCNNKICWKDSACCGDHCCPYPRVCCGTTCCSS